MRLFRSVTCRSVASAGSLAHTLLNHDQVSWGQGESLSVLKGSEGSGKVYRDAGIVLGFAREIVMNHQALSWWVFTENHEDCHWS